MNLIKRLNCQRVLSIAVCGAVVFPVWAYGGTENWAIFIFSSLSLAVFAGALVCCVRRQHSDGHVGRLCSGQHFVFYPLAAITVLIIIQFLNPSHRYLPQFEQLVPIQHISRLPATVAAGLTLNSLLLFLSYVSIYWVIALVLRCNSIDIVVGNAVMD